MQEKKRTFPCKNNYNYADCAREVGEGLQVLGGRIKFLTCRGVHFFLANSCIQIIFAA